MTWYPFWNSANRVLIAPIMVPMSTFYIYSQIKKYNHYNNESSICDSFNNK